MTLDRSLLNYDVAVTIVDSGLIRWPCEAVLSVVVRLLRVVVLAVDLC